jgi:hypothetical protein
MVSPWRRSVTGCDCLNKAEPPDYNNEGAPLRRAANARYAGRLPSPFGTVRGLYVFRARDWYGRVCLSHSAVNQTVVAGVELKISTRGLKWDVWLRDSAYASVHSLP